MKESTASLSSRKKADGNAECDENHEGTGLKHGEVMHKHRQSPAVILLCQIRIKISAKFRPVLNSDWSGGVPEFSSSLLGDIYLIFLVKSLSCPLILQLYISNKTLWVCYYWKINRLTDFFLITEHPVMFH